MRDATGVAVRAFLVPALGDETPPDITARQQRLLSSSSPAGKETNGGGTRTRHAEENDLEYFLI
jgi:hypothetical protein